MSEATAKPPRHAYVDESDRGSQYYLVCASVIDPSRADTVRAAMRALLRPGMARLHMKTEKDRLKKATLSAIEQAPVSTTLYKAGHRVRREGRAEILRHIVTELAIDRLVLESRAVQDHEEMRVLYGAARKAGKEYDFTYVHLRASSEPLLWVPDAVAWAYGKGGDEQ